MGRAAVPLDTIWPNGSDPKTLVCVRAQCSVADLFNTVFGESDLTEQLHKQRGDAELVDTPWYPAKEDLPAQLYTWQVSDPPNKPTDTLRHRKVRFESPPTALASKPFQNEELQVVTELYPDTLYVVEAVSSTSAPYGDKFNVFFRYIFRTDGTTASALHVLFHVEWLPAMNRMMRPVVGKAIDAGVRGTFRIFRSVLGTLQPVVDIKETEMPVEGPPAVVTHEPTVEGAPVEGGPAEAAMMAPHPLPHPAPAAGFAPGMGPPPGLLSVMTQQLVYKDQVVLLADLLGAGLRSVSATDLGAQLMAAALTIWLISIVVAALRGWQALCANGDAGSADGGGGGRGLMWLLRLGVCWPLNLIDLPDSTAEVLASLALVAAINWAVIRGSEVVVRYVSQQYPGLLTPPRGGPGGGAAAGDVIGGVPFSQTPVMTRGSSGGGAGPGAGGRSVGGGFGSGVGSPASTSASISRVASTAAGGGPGAAGGAPTSSSGAGGKDKEKDKSAKGGGAGGGVTGGQSFLAAAMANAANKAAAAKAKPLRAAPPPRQFTPAQMRQLELGQISSAKKPGGSSAVPPAVSASAESVTLPAPAVADAWAADVPGGVMTPTMEAPNVAPRPPSPPPPRRQPSPPPKGAAAAAPAADAAPVTVVGRTASRSSAVAAEESSSGGSPGAIAAVETTAAVVAAPAPAAPLSPSKAAAPPAPQHAAGPHVSGAAQLTAASTFANMFTKEGIDSMAESLRSAFRWDIPKAADSGEVASPELSTSPGSHQQHITKMKARSEAGGALSETAAAAVAPGRRVGSAATASGLGLRSVGGGGGSVLHSFAAAPLVSVQSDMPLLPQYDDMYGGGEDDGYDGELEPELVVEEVFENERFQPFRGWGHNWPGHFLPSDRVGHWSDRQGKPGGSASMVFEQVVPQLPSGWRWVEDDWQVDLEGLDVEGVDSDGWTYALDFYLLKYPPPPQGGKCSLKHFVRRRRYYRTRVREEGRRSTRSSGDSPLGGPLPDSGEEAEGGVRTDGDYPLAVERTLLSLSDGISDQMGEIPARPQLTQAASGPAAAPAAAAATAGAPVELQPPAAVAALPRPRSAAEGLAELLAQPPPPPTQQRQRQDDRRAARSSLSGLTGGTAAGAIQSAPEGLASAPGSQRDRFGDADGAGVLSSSPTELFVLSPKTAVTSHDPLGALMEAPGGADGELGPSDGGRQARDGAAAAAAAAAITSTAAPPEAAPDGGSAAGVVTSGARETGASKAISRKALPTEGADTGGGSSSDPAPAPVATPAPAPAGPPAASPAAPEEAAPSAAPVAGAAEAPDNEPPSTELIQGGDRASGGASGEHRMGGSEATVPGRDGAASPRVMQSPMKAKAKATPAAAPPPPAAAARTPAGAEGPQDGYEAALGPAVAVATGAAAGTGVAEGPVIAAEHVE